MKLTQMKQEGFTLIEILMVVLVIGILAAIGITQFVNFSADAKNASVKSNLAVLRNAIATENGVERIRCGKTVAGFPNLLEFIANDVTSANGGPCSLANLLDPTTGAVFGSQILLNAYLPVSDATFVAGGIPPNPWSPTGSTDAQTRTIAAWTDPGTGITRAAAGNNCVNAAFSASATAHAAILAAEYGWCYNAVTGGIWANSAMNDGLNTGTGTESQL